MEADGKIGATPGSRERQPQATTRKLRPAKFLFFSAAPTIVVLALLELGLRLTGYPCAPEDLRSPVFISEDGGATYGTRRLFVFDYQAGVLKQEFPKNELPGAFRVALVGGSSVASLGQATRLQNLLMAGLRRSVKIINFGFCGTGSDRVLLSVREALQYGVDAVLVYTGHNEFSSHSDRRKYLPTNMLLQNCRLCQLVKPAWRPHPGRLYSESEKDQIYLEFRRNLEAIVKTINGRGPIMVWGTVPANYEFPPVIYSSPSYTQSKLPPRPLAAYQRGDRLLQAGRRAEARPYLIEAFSSSPRPMRATPRINQIIREVAAEHRVPLADVERLVIDASPDGIPGYALFGDHCHLNDRGNDILQEAFAARLIPLALEPRKT